VRRVAAALLCVAALPLSAGTPPAPRQAGDAVSLSDAELDARVNEIGALLRCPVCQGLSVADSPSTMARNMKAEVREKLAAGYDQERILAEFERSYGEFVRLDPPLRGANWLVWFGPLAALLAGAAAIAMTLRRRAARPDGAARATPDCPSRDSLPDDPRLAACVRTVRQIAYGWPDGVAPKGERG
jgi:cytochrome c-type biogenesis protein CcmH